jgi:hypothetical protein
MFQAERGLLMKLETWSCPHKRHEARMTNFVGMPAVFSMVLMGVPSVGQVGGRFRYESARAWFNLKHDRF